MQPLTRRAATAPPARPTLPRVDLPSPGMPLSATSGAQYEEKSRIQRLCATLAYQTWQSDPSKPHIFVLTDVYHFTRSVARQLQLSVEDLVLAFIYSTRYAAALSAKPAVQLEPAYRGVDPCAVIKARLLHAVYLGQSVLYDRTLKKAVWLRLSRLSWPAFIEQQMLYCQAIGWSCYFSFPLYASTLASMMGGQCKQAAEAAFEKLFLFPYSPPYAVMPRSASAASWPGSVPAEAALAVASATQIADDQDMSIAEAVEQLRLQHPRDNDRRSQSTCDTTGGSTSPQAASSTPASVASPAAAASPCSQPEFVPVASAAATAAASLHDRAAEASALHSMRSSMMPALLGTVASDRDALASISNSASTNAATKSTDPQQYLGVPPSPTADLLSRVRMALNMKKRRRSLTPSAVRETKRVHLYYGSPLADRRAG